MTEGSASVLSIVAYSIVAGWNDAECRRAAVAVLVTARIAAIPTSVPMFVCLNRKRQ